MTDMGRAAQRARDLLRTYSVEQPPVDVEWIVSQEGLAIVYEPLEDSVSGVLVCREDAASVGVNARHHKNRQRFTLAHELGHHQLHPHSPTVFVDDLMIHFRGEGSIPTCEELEANAFAAALLMPQEFLLRDLAERAIDASDESAVRSLAQRYGVSQQALTLRLVELGCLRGYTHPRLPWLTTTPQTDPRP